MTRNNQTLLHDAHIITEKLRHAAATLNPVVVSMDNTSSKFASYVDSIVSNNGTQSLILEPIAADAIRELKEKPSQVVVKSSDPSHPWMFSEKEIQLLDANRAAIPLNNINFCMMPLREHARINQPEISGLVLMASSDTDEEKASAFPVVDLSSSGCCIDTENPWQPGRHLQQVDIIGASSQHIRREKARILECLPWYTPQHEKRYRCRLIFDESQSIIPQTTGNYIKNKTIINKTLQLLANTHTRLLFSNKSNNQNQATIDAFNAQTISLNTDCQYELSKFEFILIKFELFSVQYEFESRILSFDGKNLTISKPEHIKCIRQRWSQRLRNDNVSKLTISFIHPATGKTINRKVIDISSGGLSFQLSKYGDVFWKNLTLNNAQLLWDKTVLQLGNIEVRGITTDQHFVVCHAMFRSFEITKNSQFSSFLLKISYPELDYYTSNDYSNLICLYEKSGLLKEYFKKNFSAETPKCWETLAQSPGLGDILVHYEEKKESIDGAIMSLRMWEQTYLAQHFASIGPKSIRIAGRLSRAFLEHAFLPNHGDYLAFFAEEPKLNTYYKNIFEESGMRGAIDWKEFSIWRLSAKESYLDNYELSTDSSLEVIEVTDEHLIQRLIERKMGQLVSQALSLTHGDFRLTKLSEYYSKFGFHRTRTPMLLTIDQKPHFLLLKEEMSPGLNFSWTFNSHWILPLSREPNQTNIFTPWILEHIRKSKSNAPTGDHFIVTSGIKKDEIETPNYHGLTFLRTLHLFVMNRAGVNRVFERIMIRPSDLR